MAVGAIVGGDQVEASGSAHARVGAGERSGYRPHLDGLRAVAVYLVVLFHAGVDRFSAGFIGVDVFFVLSGYLVTQLLMRDLSAGGGRIRFGRFYARRMRRLLPASAVLLIVTAVVYSAIASPAEIVSAVGSFKAAFLYVANWYFIHQSSDYFATDINTNPVIHFWSLAIEEQFYFVWPLLLGGLYAATRRFAARARLMQGAVVAAGLASLLWALHFSAENVNRAYYGTDARAYQLLAGAFLALSPGLVRRAARSRWAPVVALGALGALVILASSLINVNVVRRGVGAAIVTATLIVAIEAARRGPVNRVLSWSPAVYLGKISYGTYLWHWPVILVTLHLTDDKISPLSLFLVSAFVATGFASLSYTILERPIREQKLLDRVNPVVILTGLGVSVLCAVVLIPYILDPSRSTASAISNDSPVGVTTRVSDAEMQAATDDLYRIEHAGAPNVGPGLKGVKFPPAWDCFGQPSSDCTIVKGTGKHIMVVGDSHAWMMFPTFAKIAQQHHLTLSVSAQGGCPWQRNFYDIEDRPNIESLHQRCADAKKDLYGRVLPQLKPDLLIVVSYDYFDVGAIWGKNNTRIDAPNPGALTRLVEEDTEQSIKMLEKSADQIVIVDPVPTTTFENDPLHCLTTTGRPDHCRFVTDRQPSAIEGIYRDIEDGRRVIGADFDKLVCPYKPICDPVINGLVVRFDRQHITPRFALSIAPGVAAFLAENRLIPSSTAGS